MARIRTEIKVNSEVGNAYLEANPFNERIIRFQIPVAKAVYSAPEETNRNHYLTIEDKDGFFDALIEALILFKGVSNVPEMP